MKLTIDGKPVKFLNDVIEQLLKDLYRIQMEGGPASGRVFVSRLAISSKVDFVTVSDPLPYLEIMRGDGWLEPVRRRGQERPLDVNDEVRLTADGIRKAEWLVTSRFKRHLKEYVGLTIESVSAGITRGMLER